MCDNRTIGQPARVCMEVVATALAAPRGRRDEAVEEHAQKDRVLVHLAEPLVRHVYGILQNTACTLIQWCIAERGWYLARQRYVTDG